MNFNPYFRPFLRTCLLILCHLSFSTCLMQVITHLSRIWFHIFQNSHTKCISMREHMMQRKNLVTIQGGPSGRLTVRFLALLRTNFWRARPRIWMRGKMSQKWAQSTFLIWIVILTWYWDTSYSVPNQSRRGLPCSSLSTFTISLQ